MIKKTHNVRIAPLKCMLLMGSMMALFFANANAETNLWEQNFSGGAVGEKPPGWYDESDNASFNCEIAYNVTDGYVDVTTVDTVGWGKVEYTPQSTDLSIYTKLEVVVSAVDSNAGLKVGIFHPSPSYVRWECIDSGSITEAGVYTFDIPSETGETGVQMYGVDLVVEGAQSKTVVIDSVRIYAPDPTPTMTPSPDYTHTPSPTESPDYTHTITPTITPTPTISPTVTASPTASYYVYEETFAGTVNTQPAGWVDESNSSDFNAEIVYSYQGQWAGITRTADSDWGKVLSPTQTIDVAAYPVLRIEIAGLSKDARWRVGIQEQTGSNDHEYLNEMSTETGVFYFLYADAMGWNSGTHIFSIEIVIEGMAGTYVEVNSVAIGEINVMPPTPTVTITPVTENEFRPSLNLFKPKQAPLILHYKIKSLETVNIKVYNLAGRKVRTLLDRGYPGQIDSQIEWDGKNDQGDWVASGVYIIRLESKNIEKEDRFFKNIRVVVVK